MSYAVAPPGKRKWNLTPPFRHDGGLAWVAELPPELWNDTDDNDHSHRSTLRVLENSTELGPAHAVHATIQAAGDGRYSFWMNVVYFSSSDGSDPNTNGRTYSVAPTPPLQDFRSVQQAIAPSNSVQWSAPDEPIRCAFVGLGNRGRALARIVGGFDGVKIAWLVDVSPERIAEVQADVNLPDARTSNDFMAALEDPAVDAVFITVPDHLHRLVAEEAFLAKKHVFLEKPIATTTADGKAIAAAWLASGRIFQLGYVLRWTPFYQAIRNVIRQNRLGPIRVISLSEQLSVVHGASFLRRWHAESSSLMVHKSCHDLDLVCWLLDSRPRLVGSLGGLSTFRRPAPAPFCSQCAVRPDCPYADKGLHENRTAAERADPSAYGLDRCVFRQDDSIVDNQVVSFELESGVRGTYYLAMQGPRRSERRITLIGDAGRLDGIFEDGRFTIVHTDPNNEPLVWSTKGRKLGGHGGGDVSSTISFLNACLGHSSPPIKTAEAALAGLVFAASAEQSRNSHEMVTVGDVDFRPD
ncbi:Gfo/Idh/MocA family oxidoreductase [uncultured Reyranella sp.]|uniref:Gfo/Idh/MocA family protein n=1 Tax=uncultured Reyranella sp. TaxID=735512 RepID=UPI0025DBBF8C|nr:Gfo/Idh/MocA family oxidoreductase [uncultured Reyranella sp.]